MTSVSARQQVRVIVWSDETTIAKASRPGATPGPPPDDTSAHPGAASQ
jgi:hypothetical protein